MEQILWVVDLNLTHSDSLAQMKLIKYVTNGSFDCERSTFQVPVKVKKSESELAVSRKRKSIAPVEVWKSNLIAVVFNGKSRHLLLYLCLSCSLLQILTVTRYSVHDLSTAT